MPLAYNALLFTPAGPKYLYNLKQGSPIWVYDHDRYVTEPLRYEIGRQRSTLRVNVFQQQYTRFQGQIMKGGACGYSYDTVDHPVLTLGGFVPLDEVQKRKLPRIPYQLLRTIPAKPGGYLPMDRALSKLERRSKRKPEPKGQPLSILAPGPMDDVTEFGDYPIITKVVDEETSLPTVYLFNRNAVAYHLIVKGD